MDKDQKKFLFRQGSLVLFAAILFVALAYGINVFDPGMRLR